MSFFANAESYICEVNAAAGIYHDRNNNQWEGAPFKIEKETKQFTISKVVENDYKDGTFELFDKIHKPYTAELIQPKYKIKVIYGRYSRVFDVCMKDFNENGYLNCADGDLLFNRNNMRFQRFDMGSFIHGCDKKNENCRMPLIRTGYCNKL